MFAESCYFTPDEVDALPIYLACLLMGAVGPDQTELRMTAKDYQRYFGSKHAKQVAKRWKVKA